MRRLFATTIAVLVLSSSTLATGGIFITISGNQGQIKTQGSVFRYSQSPRDLAGQSTSMAAASGAATSARGASGGRAAMRRMNEPVVIVHNLDESSAFFVKAAASGETLTSVVFEFKRAVGSGTEVFQTVTLTNAIVSSVKTINGGIQPTEEVSFTFQKIEYQNKDGAAAAPASWH
jgi:type VI secretion system Hcp family effector